MSQAISVAIILLTLFSFNQAQASNLLKIIVPAYFYPTTNAAAWQNLTAQAARFPYRVVAVTNPNSGPGTAVDPNYQQAINTFQSSYGISIGYVATNYSNRAISNVIADIDKFYTFYPSINGIFFDEASYVTGSQDYYQRLYRYVKAKDACGLVVTNPGTTTLESYLVFNGSKVADVICIYERGTTQNAASWSQAAWTKQYDRSNFYAIFHTIAAADYPTVIDKAYQQNVGWIYVTNDGADGNPYDSLSSYFAAEVTYASTFAKNDKCLWNLF